MTLFQIGNEHMPNILFRSLISEGLSMLLQLFQKEKAGTRKGRQECWKEFAIHVKLASGGARKAYYVPFHRQNLFPLLSVFYNL